MRTSRSVMGLSVLAVSFVLSASCATPNPDANTTRSYALAEPGMFDFNMPKPELGLASSLPVMSSGLVNGPNFAAQGVEETDSSVSVVDILVGQRKLKDDFWENTDLEEAVTFGVQYAGQGADSWVGFEVGLIGSQSDSDVLGGVVDVTLTTIELFVGVHKTFGSSSWPVRPYVGGGLALVAAVFEADGPGGTADADDSSPGFYVHGGAAWQVARSFRLGLDLRVLTGTDYTGDFDGVDTDYTQLALFIGFGH